MAWPGSAVPIDRDVPVRGARVRVRLGGVHVRALCVRGEAAGACAVGVCCLEHGLSCGLWLVVPARCAVRVVQRGV